MSYVATLHFVRNYITYKIITVPTPTVGWAWLLQNQGGGGGVRSDFSGNPGPININLTNVIACVQGYHLTTNMVAVTEKPVLPKKRGFP
jgi:hypothetical protein